MIGSESTQVISSQMENLTLKHQSASGSSAAAAGVVIEEQQDQIDWTDIRKALAESEVQKAQQKLVAAQRQIAANCQNGVPPKQLLLYLVR